MTLIFSIKKIDKKSDIYNDNILYYHYICQILLILYIYYIVLQIHEIS